MITRKVRKQQKSTVLELLLLFHLFKISNQFKLKNTSIMLLTPTVHSLVGVLILMPSQEIWMKILRMSPLLIKLNLILLSILNSIIIISTLNYSLQVLSILFLSLDSLIIKSILNICKLLILILKSKHIDIHYH